MLHTRPAGPRATREPLQFGAEIYGHAGAEADLEVLSLALDCLRAARVSGLRVDLGHAGVVKALLGDVVLDESTWAALHQALATKDQAALQAALAPAQVPAAVLADLCALTGLYGGLDVLDLAKKAIQRAPFLEGVLSNLKFLASHLDTDVVVSVDLGDLRGYTYYSGARFAIYADGAPDALVRGGRYDEVGAVFGRRRPAVGFSLDVRELAAAAPRQPLRAAVRAPWGEQAALRQAIAGLRARGETVVCVLPGHEHQVDEFDCDRELIEVAGQWVLQAL